MNVDDTGSGQRIYISQEYRGSGYCPEGDGSVNVVEDTIGEVG